MNRIICVLTVSLCGLSATPLRAGSGQYYVVAFSGSRSTAVSLVRDADYVCMPLTIQSGQKQPEARFEEIRQAQDLILAVAAGRSGIEIHRGPIALSLQTESKFTSLSSYDYAPSSTTRFYVLAKLDDESDIYTCAARIRQFLDAVVLPGKAEYSLGQIQLVMGEPERYRQELLKKIAEDITFLKEAMQASGTVSVRGLEQPVLVRQVDDRRVELFIHYSMTLDLADRDRDNDVK